VLSDAMQQVSTLAMWLESSAPVPSRHVQLIRESAVLQRRLKEVMQRLQVEPLTGIYHRHALNDRLDAQCQAAGEDKSCVGILFIDIDRFQLFNAAHGHGAGDLALRRVAQVIRGTIRDKDFPIRYGGDEFVVVICQPRRQTIRGVAERILKAIEAEVIELDGKSTRLTASIGAVLASPSRQDAEFSKRFVASAAAAMHQAREQGGNRAVVSDDWDLPDEQFSDADRTLLDSRRFDFISASDGIVSAST
jgi:diguanylate cyclase (GGDEF)-like protein